MTKKITTIIVDDEPLACKRIAKLLREDDKVEIKSICHNGGEAIKEINEQQPDIVFLDIQMPEIDGFDVLKNIEADTLPVIVFVTAYDEYALQAFNVHALDYLLKPFDKDRFFYALERAKNATRPSSNMVINEKLDDLLQSLDKSAKPLKRVMVKSSERYFFLNAGEIDWIESDGNYVRIHSGEENYMLRETMKNMEDKLDSDTFFRIHRSTIVNIDKVKELEQWFHGDYKVIMKTGEELTMSRNYKEMLQRFV